MAKSDVAQIINGKELFPITCDGCGQIICLADEMDTPYSLEGVELSAVAYSNLHVWSPDDDHDYCEHCSDDYVTCQDCGEILHRDDACELDEGMFVCEDCRDNNYFCCAECGEWRPDDDGYGTADGDRICEACYDEYYYRCERCDSVFRIEDGVEIEGYGRVCESCLDSIDQCTCDGCGSHILVEDAQNEEDEDGDIIETLCSRCFRARHPEMRTSVPSYHGDNTPFKPHDDNGNVIADYDEYQKLRFKKLFVGTEWEMERGGTNYQKGLAISRALGMDHAKGECRMERDGSLCDGIELISMPGTLEYFTKHLKLEEGFELAKKYGYRSHDGGNCGAHIHIDRTYFTDSMFNPEYALIILVQNNRDWLQSFSRRERDRMGYCRFFEDSTPFTADDFKPTESGGHEQEERTMSRLQRMRGAYSGHGSALNFSGSSTMEIRFFRGSLVPQTIRANHELVEMMGYAMKHLSDVQLCNVNLQWFKRFAKRKNYTNFLEYIKERGLIA